MIKINWFPGHMVKALREIQNKIKLVDIVLEIRDARLPLTSGNPKIHALLGNKKRIIILNKIDLAEEAVIKQWKKYFAEHQEPYIFTSCFDQNFFKKVTKQAQILMQKKWDNLKSRGIQLCMLRMLVLGLPNTGKSTLINRLAQKGITKTGKNPGVTQHQQWIVLNQQFELLDTPGIMPPKIEQYEQGLQLCCINAIKDGIVPLENVVKYLIEQYLKTDPSILQQHYKINTELNVTSILTAIIQKYAASIINKNEHQIYQMILDDFRSGKLGPKSFE